MPVPSLASLALKRLSHNIANITDIGDAPFTLIAPLLARIENPAQLRALETSSPHLKPHTSELWHKLCKRDIPHYNRAAHAPRDPTNWGRMYAKLKKEAEREAAKAEAVLAQRMRDVKAERERNLVSAPVRVIVPNSRRRVADRGLVDRFRGQVRRTPVGVSRIGVVERAPAAMVPQRGPLVKPAGAGGIRTSRVGEGKEREKGVERQKGIESVEEPGPSAPPPAPASGGMRKRKREVNVLLPNKRR
ncbi:hypothetical protein EJ06DRAFT_580453 [Trichodelitschia bisporula]|uniref:Elongin-A n=1 Tax=Trichodelitschia bisporula TaxID=703511 RepID=A0A6G1I1X9_9PEZI|nr:hypothetical protein EJ06DRAFT_580453 [Trichodelitschia bisporula]